MGEEGGDDGCDGLPTMRMYKGGAEVVLLVDVGAELCESLHRLRVAVYRGDVHGRHATSLYHVHVRPRPSTSSRTMRSLPRPATWWRGAMFSAP